MIPTHFLFQLADYEGIAIEWRDMHHVQGIYIHAPGAYKPVIALSNTLHTQERKLRCVLAHELGHHFTTSGHYIIAANSTSSIYATKHENLATKWAVNLLIPTDIFFGLHPQRDALSRALQLFLCLTRVHHPKNQAVT